MGFRQRSLHPWSRRLRDAWAGRFGARPPRSQRVYRVDVAGRPCKRVVFPDSHAAAQTAARLREFGAEGLYPALLLERERELWVEFVEGDRLTRADRETVEALAAWLAAVNRRAPRRVDRGVSGIDHALEVDLGFLADVGVLTSSEAQALRELGTRTAPRELWQGHDCTDFILKNFVRTPDGRVRAVDLESLGADVPLGWAAAKAGLRWLGDERETFLAALRRAGAPDYLPDLPYLELCFTAFWTKSSFLEGKSRFVDPAHLRRFLGA